MNRELATSSTCISEHMTRLEAAEPNISENTRVIDGITRDYNEMREDVDDAFINLEMSMQRHLRNGLEILGVPLKSNENVETLVIPLFKLLTIEIDERDINSCYRAGNSSRATRNGETLYPPIILDLDRENLKNKVLDRLRVLKKQFISIDLGFADVAASLIFINERLTRYMMQIYLDGHKLKNVGLLNYGWIKNGMIPDRVADGIPVLTFLHVNDVKSCVGGDDLDGEDCSEQDGFPEAKATNEFMDISGDRKFLGLPVGTVAESKRK